MMMMMMMKGCSGDLMVDENLSVLTSCASGEISASNSGLRNEETDTLYPQQHSSSASTNQPQRKKRNLPGNPDPEAEVIALSPKTLMATNRFICEVCKKGFQRDQNLQLHRRGHNLPWKLKQRNNKEVIRKKVYLCPEISCVHHHPSRALGDLTGIKKHFSRKHGEKKWKCDKCSKRYAVQSDWKAHSKICGTREYKCDCGTIFSRRDSFITHRAFCDALAHESTAITSSSSTAMAAINPLLLHHHNHNNATSILQSFHPLLPVKGEQGDHFFSLTSQAPPWLLAHPPQTPLLLPQNNNNNNNNNVVVTTAGLFSSVSASSAPPPPPPPPPLLFGSCPMWELSSKEEQETLLNSTFEEASFEEALSGILMSQSQSQSQTNNKDVVGGGGGGDDVGETTRDFLGLRSALARADHHHIFDNDTMNAMNNSSSTIYGMHHHHRHQNHAHTTFWRD